MTARGAGGGGVMLVGHVSVVTLIHGTNINASGPRLAYINDPVADIDREMGRGLVGPTL